jgi:hypothetical protein
MLAFELSLTSEAAFRAGNRSSRGGSRPVQRADGNFLLVPQPSCDESVRVLGVNRWARTYLSPDGGGAMVCLSYKKIETYF